MALPLRAVQVGAGRFSFEHHGPALKRLASAAAPRISLEAICDLDLERAELFCRSFGWARAYTDVDRMIRETLPDVIYCMVHPEATAEVVGRLLPLGLPVFTEKPPGVTVEQAEGLARAARRHGNITYVAFNRRRVPGLLRLKSWVREHGPVRYVRAEMVRNRRLEPEFAVGTAIHPLDYLRFLCGNPVEVCTSALPYGGSAARDYLVRMHFDSGTAAELAVLVDCGYSRERYIAHVQNAACEVTLGAGYSSSFCPALEREYRDNAIVADSAAAADPLQAGGFVGEHDAFLDAVARNEAPDCTLEDAAQSLRLAAAVQELYSGPFPPAVR
jgi:myo-inositol 2-dehydrogenase / D-chiro-inositol 1-dehydrogenase